MEGLQGLIIYSRNDAHRELYEHLKLKGIPMIAVMDGVSGEITMVTCAVEKCFYDLTQHLIDLGHKRIGFIGGESDYSQSAIRLNSFRKAMDDNALAIESDLVFDAGAFSYQQAYQGLKNRFDFSKEVDAFVCASDGVALAVISYLQAAGKKVPGDVSVVGFDNLVFRNNLDPALSDPPLTTVNYPGFEIGWQASTSKSLALRSVQSRQTSRSMKCLLMRRTTSDTNHTMSPQTQQNTQEIFFAGGCLWGVQEYLRHLPGVVATEAGRANGTTQNLQGVYDGYAECVRTQFDPAAVSLEQLIAYFFEIIDPYSLNQQGQDVGEKYRTGIYSKDPDHLKQAKAWLQARADAAQIAVEILPLSNYIKSAEEHQDRLTRCPTDTCHLPEELLQKYRKTE